MKNIGIVGLGLIGGSMAKASARAGYRVFGSDRDQSVVDAAISDGTLAGRLEDHMEELDLVLVALYPGDVVDIILELGQKLPKGCMVIDCTGVKQVICRPLSGKLAQMGLRFIGGHPMAGKEVAGYKNAAGDLFDGASMILCQDEYTDKGALDEARDFFPGLGFSRVVITTASEHDRVIAYTSQLAHVVSSSYIKSTTLDERYGFSAGSFKDLTRVAKLDENMWADLFLANRDSLLDEIGQIRDHLTEYYDAIESGDREVLVSLLRDGRIRKETDTKKEEEAKKGRA